MILNPLLNPILHQKLMNRISIKLTETFQKVSFLITKIKTTLKIIADYLTYRISKWKRVETMQILKEITEDKKGN